MRRTYIIIGVTALLALLVLAGGVYAFDSSRKQTIANGVKVGTVDVGGLSTAQARKRLRARLLAPLEKPLVVVAGETKFPLSAREAKLDADIDAMVAAAVKRSRDDSIIARTWRGVTGGKLDETVTPKVAYSPAAVRRLVDKVRVRMTRKPVDADISATGSRVRVRRSKIGLSVDPKALREQVQVALVSATGAKRTVRATLRKTQPKVTTKRLASKYAVALTVDRRHFRISLFKHLKHVKTYPIAVGQAGLETPAGRYTIKNKAINPAWHVPNSPWAGSLAGTVIPGGIPSNPLKSRWLGIADGVGVHGTSDRGSIGSNASHGCIRMLVEDVEKLYDQVPIGTPIFIN
jgi:lipoprotein-anchoring transpeptidase ErfK/SrfK